MTTPPTSVPDFDDLPKVKDMPQGCSWGLFDHDGKKDVLGTLNFLTPDIVKAAAAEVKDGVSISLNWRLDGFRNIPMPGRPPPEHKILYLPDAETGHCPAISWDDHLSFNTQCSSQWDSLCHYQHQPTGLAYNGFRPTKESLAAASASTSTDAPTLEHWHQRGGVVARAVLVDFKAYTEDKGTPFHAFDGSSITVDQLEACAAHQGVEFRPGDVLIVRTGATEILDNLPPHMFEQMIQPDSGAGISGLEGSEDMARWLWNKRFAGAAADNSSLEVYPPKKPDGTVGDTEDLVLHPYMLGCFGMPIGELWDLSRLSRYCREKKRYSFMLTSVPLNQPGLIGSPPNALAIL
ncbi:hypothetical protein ACO1O0_002804 [Amphichorda felina]